jgi:hypothetical protein
MEARPDELELLGRPSDPNPDPAVGVVVEEADPRLFEGGLDAHQGRDVAHDRPPGPRSAGWGY